MSQTTHKDPEKANNADSDQTLSTQNNPLQPSGGASSSGDSSGPFFSIYSKAAEEEDNKMVERWQKDADGILIFMGLFSAAVAALLAVTVQDLRPNSQDTSAFYLGIIYQVLADPNATLTSLLPPVLQPPPFSPPRYAVWVNSLWFLSLVLGLGCALLATSLHQWARRYIRLTQPARVSPEKRARMRAFFADGLDKMHVPRIVEALPTLLHLSLFLFFAGLAIFLFHVDRQVFGSVVWWIGLFAMVYVSITLLPLIQHDSPYYAPLSTPAWFLYSGTLYATLKILGFITTACYSGYCRIWSRARCNHTREHWIGIWRDWENLSDHYRRWMLGGVERAAEKTASERLSEIDIRIFDWTISALGDDVSLEKFFEAIPGLVNSNLVHNFREHLSNDLLDRLSVVAHGFLGRTWSSNLVSDSEKIRRLDIAMNAMALIRVSDVSSILHNILFKHWDEVPQSIEMGHTLARWCTSDDKEVAMYARFIIGGILGNARERNDSWVTLASRVSDPAEHDLQDDIANGGDSVLLSILNQLASLHRCPADELGVFWRVLRLICKLDICTTLPRPQHDFCALWNEVVRKATSTYSPTPIQVLDLLSPHYEALHEGIESTDSNFFTSPFSRSLYPICNIASHHPNSTTRVPVPNSNAFFPPIPSSNSPDASPRSPSSPHSGSSIVSQQLEQRDTIIAGPPLPSNSKTTTNEIGEAQAPQDLSLSAIPRISPIPINADPPGPPLALAFPPATDGVWNDSPHDSHDQNETIPMKEVFHHQTQSLGLVPSPPDTASNPLGD